jgi:hypothetical protein
MRQHAKHRRRFRIALWCAVAVWAPGCMSAPTTSANPAVLPEPAGGYEHVWNTTVRVVDRYFDVASENRYDGTIESFPETGGTVLEPWRQDSVGLYEKLESSFQTIRRRAFVAIRPAPGGGYLASVEVYKELEHLPQPVYTNFGGGTLVQSIQPLQDQVLDADVTPGLGWISLGRDPKLEALILHDLQCELGCLDAGGRRPVR